MMAERITVVALGVADIADATALCHGLDWRPSAANQFDNTFIQGQGTVMALFGRSELAWDTGVARGTRARGGVTLAYNAKDKPEHETDQAFAHAIAFAGTVLRAPRDIFWSRNSGERADPDRHVWEVAYSSLFPFAHGRVVPPAPTRLT
jgi:hypothetical protein